MRGADHVMGFDGVDRGLFGFTLRLSHSGRSFATSPSSVVPAVREILRVTEQNAPAGAKPTVESDRTVRAVLFEIGGNLPRLDRRGLLHAVHP